MQKFFKHIKLKNADNYQTNKLQKKLSHNDVVMLTTIDLRGKPKSRPLPALASNMSDVWWFFSDEFFGKTNEITLHPLVCLSYSNFITQTYLSITGEAHLIYDPQKMYTLWEPSLKKWFPESLSTPNLLLLKIIIEEFEVWDKDPNKIIQ